SRSGLPEGPLARIGPGSSRGAAWRERAKRRAEQLHPLHVAGVRAVRRRAHDEPATFVRAEVGYEDSGFGAQSDRSTILRAWLWRIRYSGLGTFFLVRSASGISIVVGGARWWVW